MYRDCEACLSRLVSEVVLELLQYVSGDDLLRIVVRLHETFRRQLHDAAVCKIGNS